MPKDRGLTVDIVDEATGQPVSRQTLKLADLMSDSFTVTFAADRVGQFLVRPPVELASAQPDAQPLSISVISPRLEMDNPQVDQEMVARLAPPAQVVSLQDAREKLPLLIKSAAQIKRPSSDTPLWDRWIILIFFVLLLTTEWVLRKVFGMI